MIFPEFGIRTELAVAVVFPELVRYSALMDFMETTAVKALYQQKGVKGADFSIGRFQMKPSFVEDLERQWMRTEWRHEYGIYFDLSETWRPTAYAYSGWTTGTGNVFIWPCS